MVIRLNTKEEVRCVVQNARENKCTIEGKLSHGTIRIIKEGVVIYQALAKDENRWLVVYREEYFKSSAVILNDEN